MGVRTTTFVCTSMVLVLVTQMLFMLAHIHVPIVPLLAVLMLSFIFGTLIYLDTDLRLRNKELAQAREAMQVRAEEERQRIAEDLHDETLPALSSVARMADKLSQDMEDNEVPTLMREKLDQAVVEMRRVINDLHPSVLETMGFKPALENLLVALEREMNIETKFNEGDDQDDYGLSDMTKLQLYRIVQEGLNNIYKHSQAKFVEVSIGLQEADLLIKVTDNGKGIDPAKIRSDSHGLLNIRQRAQLIGAQVEWAKPKQYATGTELKLIIPVNGHQVDSEKS
jgi:Signal transduction histidine kinase